MEFDAKVAHDIIIDWIKGWFKDKNGPAVLGISGGKDSTICLLFLLKPLDQKM